VTRAYEVAPPGFAAILDEEAEWLKACAAEGPLLEVGCGAGRLLAAARFRSRSLVGMDLVLRYLTAARRSVGGVGWVASDAQRPPFAPETFSTVVFAQATVGSLGGDELRRRILGEIARLLVPGGVLLVTAYGRGCREARRAWYRAQQDAGLLPPFDEAQTSGGRFVFTNGFVSEEMTVEGLAALKPPGLDGGVKALKTGLLGARWSRAITRDRSANGAS